MTGQEEITNPTNPETTSQSQISQNLTKQEAIVAITQKIQILEFSKQLNTEELQFWIEKLVLDILDYCHRCDFPEALIYTCVDLIRKRLSDADNREESLIGPLSEIKQDDTSFKFAVDNVDVSGLLSDLAFDSIKPRLNLYRKVVSL